MHEFAVYSTEPETHFRVVPNKNSCIEQRNLNELIQERIKSGKRFYGIEISPSPKGRDLDYNCFGDLQPMFTSITWLFDHNINCEPISKSPAVTLTRSVQKCNPVLLHLTCYKLSNPKLQEIIGNGITNLFALRGGLYSLPIVIKPKTISHINLTNKWKNEITLFILLFSFRSRNRRATLEICHRFGKSDTSNKE